MSAKVQGWAWDQDVLVQRKAILLWLANRATDTGVCFPGLAEIRLKTGLSESMVRRHLHWLASDQDEDGQPKAPLLEIIERPVCGSRHTSNVYVLRVPWAQPEDVRAELAELKYVPAEVLGGVGSTGATQGGGWHPCQPVGSTGAPQVGGTGARQEPLTRNLDRETPPYPPRRSSRRGAWPRPQARVPGSPMSRPRSWKGWVAPVLPRGEGGIHASQWVAPVRPRWLAPVPGRNYYERT